MDIDAVREALASDNPQDRLRGLTQLRNSDTETAVPLLLAKRRDPEFMVRSFVAMGLGRHRTEESFAALLELLKGDGDYNVRAEAANSLSMYGESALPHLLEAFRLDDQWLVRRSILAALIESPHTEALYQICVLALEDADLTVVEAGIDGLGALGRTEKRAEALALLLPKVADQEWRTRYRVARALQPHADDPRAKAALAYLARDEDRRVATAASSP
ncbi:HEAT repeat domain-containing protein [Gloeobacter morelensis]|uniref:HEAT repeat domain-containing protein n=1 Tax=Gloeobacter morelensis MG652769 TaxID=2781736 RepID=A0ABY3PMI0_9CYAN|nr:HEAT repeat domain-containing protein [Gloeobacter morelensis]UFP94895.1 HEAT repeat domain-containing protein [Gloeobacter morelensis MG652769]